MSVLLSVDPAVAKSVWDSFEKPSPRMVAAAFRAAGVKISDGTIRNWHRNGWKSGKWKGSVSPGEKANRTLDLAAPALTGNPTTRLRDLVENIPVALPTRSVDPRRDELERKLDDELMRETARAYLVMVNLVLDAIEVNRDDLVKRVPEGLAMLIAGAGEGIVAGLSYYEKAIQLRDRAAAMLGDAIIPPGPGNGHLNGNGGKPYSNDPLADSIAAWEGKSSVS